MDGRTDGHLFHWLSHFTQLSLSSLFSHWHLVVLAAWVWWAWSRLTGIQLSRWRGYGRRGVEIVVSIDAKRGFSISGIRRQTVAVEQRIPVTPVMTDDGHAPLARTLAHRSTRGTSCWVIHRDVGTRRHVDAAGEGWQELCEVDDVRTLGKGIQTVVQKSQKSEPKYWATRSSIRLFARTAHSFACSLTPSLVGQ